MTSPTTPTPLPTPTRGIFKATYEEPWRPGVVQEFTGTLSGVSPQGEDSFLDDSLILDSLPGEQWCSLILCLSFIKTLERVG
jgi:hypothetical protein